MSSSCLKVERYARLEVTSQSEVLVHRNREAPLMASCAIVLRHELRLCPPLAQLSGQPVVDCPEVWHRWNAKFADHASAKNCAVQRV